MRWATRGSAVYDAAGRFVASVDPLGNRVSVGYDTRNRRVSMTDPLGNMSSMLYRRGRPPGGVYESTWEHMVHSL